MEGSSNGLSKKRRGKKKKKGSSCEEQVQPLKNTLSEEHNLEESLPDVTQKRKRKGKRVKESGVDIHNTNGDVFEAEGSKSTSIEGNTVASVVINSCVKDKGNTMEQQDGTSVEIDESVSRTESPKAKKRKKRKKKMTDSMPVECMVNNGDTSGRELMSDLASEKEKTKEKETDENAKVSEDVGAGLGDVRSKKQKRKKKKTSSAVVVEDTTSKAEVSTETSEVRNPGKRKESSEDATVESNQEALKAEGVSDVGRKRKRRNKNSESVANMDTESVQCLSYHSNTEGVASKAEGISKVEVKTKKKKKKKSKKKKNSLDLKTDIMEEIKDDVSVPRDDEVPEMDGEKVETSLLHNVAEGQTGDLPRCSCEGQSTKKLIVLDLNGILADIVQGDTGEFVPDGRISYRSVFRRPFVARFLDVCFEKFEVGIWSSRRIGLDYMINTVMRNHARNLLFCFDQSVCITTNFKTQENTRKPVFLKDLKKVWYRFGRCFTCGKQKYDATNTLLVDDSPHKALCNPPHTGIFPFPYQYTDLQDSSLGPNGELSKYLERLADAENVQKFVEENPFGQTAITETHESWEYYSKVIEAYK